MGLAAPTSLMSKERSQGSVRSEFYRGSPFPLGGGAAGNEQENVREAIDVEARRYADRTNEPASHGWPQYPSGVQNHSEQSNALGNNPVPTSSTMSACLTGLSNASTTPSAKTNT